MFQLNDVFERGNQRLRILWSVEDTLVWIDIDDNKALPEVSNRDDFEHAIASMAMQKIDDPYISEVLTPPPSGSRSEQIQNKAWNAIKEIIDVKPDIFISQKRGALVSKTIEQHTITKQTCYRYLRRYWQLGNCRNALSAQYKNCGGMGKTKKSGDKKRGRPRTRSPGIGINVDENIRKIFRVALETCFLKKGHYEFDYAYNRMLISFGLTPPVSPQMLTNAPTLTQFKYFFDKEFSPIEVTKAREGQVNYQKDFRPVLKTSTMEVFGPGSRYQIDATIGDIYLISQLDRSKIIGRPVIYLVVDVFSRMIVGIYVGLEVPSWVSAMEALANTICNKVDFCKQYGIEITEETWPAAGLPEALIGDKAEMLGRHVEVLSKAFHINIENTPSYRADWKGIVERYFRTIQTKFKPFVEGYVTKQKIGKKRQGNDYRLDATLTLHEFTQIMIRLVLYYNNEHELSTYDPDPDLPETLPHIPRDLWQWGISNRTGRLRSAPEDLVRINLLPHTKGTITPHGIKLFGSYYTSLEAIKFGWFERNYKGARKTTVAYDPYTANKIYIRPNDDYSEFWTADLTERSREYRNLTMWEVWLRRDIKATTSEKSKRIQRAGELNLIGAIDEILESSKEHHVDTDNKSKQERLQGIRANREKERQNERAQKTSVPNTHRAKDAIAPVIPLHGQSESSDNYQIPDMLDDLFDSEENEND